MPQVVIPYLTSIGFTPLVANVIYYVGSTIITGAAMRALSPQVGAPQQEVGTLQNVRQSAAVQEFVYGEVRKGGVMTFMQSTGSNNKYLHMVIALAGHEVEEIGDIYVNDEIVSLNASGVVTDSRWGSKITVYKHLGNQTSANDNFANASTSLAATLHTDTDATSTFIGKDIAYLYVKLEYDQEVFAGGIPTFTAIVKGKKVYDPRDGTTAYSDNAALCIRDYLTSAYGLNDASINETSFKAAANDCDDSIALDGGGTQSRYTLNGVLGAGTNIGEILQTMVTCCNGSLFYSGGQWKLKVGTYTSSVKSFTLDDFRSEIQLTTRASRTDNFNRVVGKFNYGGKASDGGGDWIETDYPPVTSTVFLDDEDNGVENTLDLSLPMITDSSRAQRVAKQQLFRSREQMTLSADFSLEAFRVEIGDIIDLTIEDYGWTNKEFEVTSWRLFSSDGQAIRVNMTLRETSEAAFDWNAEEEAIIGNNTELLPYYTVETPSLDAATTVTSINTDGTTVTQIKFTWSVTDASAVDYFQFEFKATGDTTYNIINTPATEYLLPLGVNGLSYDYRVRSVNGFGVKSGYASSVSPVATAADSTIPSAPTSVSVTAGYRAATVTWTAPTTNEDASTIEDLFQYEIYRGTSSNPTTKVGRVTTETFTDANLDDSTTYYYRVKALDYSNNPSAYSNEDSATTDAAVEGARGAGRWYVGVTSLPTTSSGADTDFTAAIGDPVDLDQAWFYTGTQSAPTAQSVWIYNGSTDTWVEQTEVIDGGLLVDGTVTADHLSASSISALGLTIGTLSSAASGARLELKDDRIQVYDSGGTVRVKIGNLS